MSGRRTWPPDYARGRDGRWRYGVDGTFVPGARDLTLGRSWTFPSVDDAVLVPASVARAVPELGWCVLAAGERRHGPARRGGPSVELLVVPADHWEDEATRVLGIDAPELNAGRLWTTNDVAAHLAIRPGTVRAYVVRGYLPLPTTPLGWSVPVLLKNLEKAAPPPPKRPVPDRPSEPMAFGPGRRTLAELIADLDAEDD